MPDDALRCYLAHLQTRIPLGTDVTALDRATISELRTTLKRLSDLNARKSAGQHRMHVAFSSLIESKSETAQSDLNEADLSHGQLAHILDFHLQKMRKTTPDVYDEIEQWEKHLIRLVDLEGHGRPCL